MTNQSDILTLINNHPDKIWTFRELVKKFSIKPDQKKEFRSKLRKLAHDGLLIRERRSYYSNQRKVHKIIGKLELTAKGFGFVIPENKSLNDFYIPKSAVHGAMPDDLVEIEPVDQSGKSDQAKIVKIITRTRKDWVGRFVKKGHKYLVINEDYFEPYQFEVDNKEGFHQLLNQMVLVRLKEDQPNASGYYSASIIEGLGFPGEKKTIYNSIIAHYGLRSVFPHEVLKEADQLKFDIELEKKLRTDLTQFAFVTIDGEDAKDFDDAVYAEKIENGFKLYVAIADVSHFVKRNSYLDQEAITRGTSVYFPDRCIPMLPEKISNHLCSLVPREPRLTLCAEIKIDDKGRLIEVSVYSALINSHERLTYQKVQEYFDQPRKVELSSEIKNSLNLLKEIADLRIQQRHQRGAIDFDFPEEKYLFDQENQLTAIVESQRFFSHKLIEECMISANIAVASLTYFSKIPSLYRVHEYPDQDKIKEFLVFLKESKISHLGLNYQKAKDFSQLVNSWHGKENADFLSMMLLRCMKVARYTSEDLGHFGLALTHYAHFTSPIRRYPDLVLHRQLNDILKAKKNKQLRFSLIQQKLEDLDEVSKLIDEINLHTETAMNGFGKTSSMMERNAMEAEREMRKLFQAEFMMNYLGESFTGIINGLNKRGLFILLKDHFVEGFLSMVELTDDYYIFDEKKHQLIGRRKRKVLKMGDSIRVKVFDISLEEKRIFFKLADDKLKSDKNKRSTSSHRSNRKRKK